MKQSLLFILFTLIFSLAPAQDIVMQNGIFNQCSGVFSDSGGVGTGAGFNYGNNEDFTVTICPDTAGTFVALDFTAFSTQATVDVLTIYDGDDNTAPVLGTYSGGPANSPGFIFASPTSATGCLTIRFVSNATGVTTGWAADISCLQSCQVIDATIDSTNPVANGTGVIEIPIGTNVQFNGSATFSDDPSTAVYQWDFGEGAPANTASANHTYNTTGTYTVTFTASDTNPTGCSDTETITVRVLENIILINDALDPESTYNIDQLVEDVLVSGGCSAVSNFTFNVAGAPADRTTKSYGYFKRGGAAGFPFAEGIMLSSGRAFPGGNTINGALVSTNNGIGGDADLEAALGQTNTNDATFVKFEFVPTQDNISFNYVMVSEEYDGNFECTFADSFAFLLRQVGTVPYQNLAVLPGGVPVSVTSINNAPGCASNPGLFAGYDVPGTNYGGQTVVLTATANVVAGQAYEIKLVMADQGDSIYDSAVFLEAGSFSLGGDLGDDVTIASGTAQCQGTTVVLDTGVDPTVIHQWSDGNGVIAGETGPTLDVTVAGTYSVEVQFAPGCVSNDSVVVEFIDGAVIDNLLDLTECDNGVDAVEFDLTVNTSEALGTQDPTFYQVSYYNSLADADVPQNPITNLTNYPGTNGEIIYVRADDTSSGACYSTSSFILTITSPDINPVPDLTECDVLPNDGFAMFDLEVQTPTILGAQPAADFTVTYYASLAEANAGTPNIVSPYQNIGSPQPIYVRIQSNTDPLCYTVSQTPVFDLIVTPQQDSSFTMTPTCDGATAVITGDAGGVFAFNPVPTDGAVIDTATGTVTGGTQSTTYTVEYTTSGPCPSTSTESFTVLSSNDTTFTLSPTCDGATATVTGDAGGTFTFNPLPTDGAVIDATTGTITNGTQGSTYTVEYSFTLPCPVSSTQSVTVFPLEDASFTTTPTCDGATVTVTGDAGGVFAFNPDPMDGSVIDPVTGTVTGGPPSATYTIEYTTTGPCPVQNTENVTVFAEETSSFTVTATCDGGTATITGDTGGTFAFNPVPTDGAVIDVATGTVTMGTPGAVYTIEYTTGGPCPDVSTVNLAVLNQDNSSFTLSPTCDGATATVTGQAGGTFAFNPVPTDGAMINTTTGTITNAPFDATYTVEYTTNGPCPTTTTQSVTVFSQPTIVPPTPLEVCDDNIPDGLTAIDLTLKNNEVTGNNPAYTVSYHLLQTQAENDTDALPNTYTNISNPQIIYVRVEDSSTGCADTAPLELRVVQAPAANTPMPLEYCDPDADGFGTFDLDSTIPEITGNAAGLTVTFHETQANAENGVVELSSPYDNIMINTQTIYVRIESATVATDCASFVQLQLIVYPTPQILDVPTTIEICDNATADGFASFDLTTNNTQILNGLDPANYEITYYTSQANAEAPSNPITTPTAYNNTTAFNDTVWVRVEDDPNPTGVTNGCYSVVAMNLVVNENPVLVQPDPLQLCDENNPGDEQEFFTLEDANAQILNGQTGISLSYHLTQNGANMDTEEITSPYENVVNPQTIFIRAENNVTGCISTTTLTLQVNPLPSPLPNPAPLTACDTDNDGIFDMFDLDSQTISILNGEPNVTITYHETEQNAIDGAMDLSSPYENIQPFSQILWVRAENNTTGCYRIVNLELQVLNSPVIPNNIDPIDATPGDNIYIVCDDNNDGFNVFNFDMNVTPVVLGTQNPADFPISYYTTQNNAISGINPITNTASYPNVTNPQTIWVRLDNANGCETIRSFQIEVEFPPVIVTPTVLNACDDLDANYYEDNDGFTTFDLTVKDGEITNNDPSLVVSYHTTAASAQAGTVTIPDPTMFVNTVNAVQTIYVRVVDANTGCFSTTTLTVRVRPNPSPTQNPMDIELCDDNNSPDGIEVFDLTQNAVDIINGEPNVSLTYYTDLNEALAGVNFIVDPTMHTNEDPANPGTGISPQTIYVRVTSGSDVNGTGGTGCYTIVDFDIIVNPLPVIPTDDLDIRECEPNTDNVFTFDLTQNTPIILGAQDGPNYAVTYHTTLLAAQNGTPQIGNPAAFTNSSNPQEIFVNISNTTTGCEIATLSFFIEVNDDAVAYPYANVFEVCDDNMEFDNDTTNDSATFDLSTQDAEVLGNDPTNPQPAADFAVSYYETQADADAGTNPLPTLYDNIVNPQVIYVRVDNNIPTGTPPVDGSFCYDVTTLTLQVNPMPSFNLDDMYLICASTNGTEVLPNDVIDTGLSAANYSFEWYLNGTVIPGQTGPTLAPQEGGSYAVIVTDNVTGCSSDLNDPNANTIVEVSTPPVITAEVVTDAFSENHTIQVTATGDGISEFEFSLDGGAYVSNEPNDGTYTFTDVSAGEHIITVRDKNGCGEASATVLAMDYPLFFTPNGDGYNDTWNIYGIANQPDATIYIFDRMGKLLKQISPTGAGWDGTYNGNPMPTSDYWFTVEYREPNSTSDEKKQFRAHFTLKR